MKEKYSLIVVFNPSVAEKDLPLEKLVTWLEDAGSQITAKNHLGLKDLAYKIKGFNKGNFWELALESETPLKLKDLNLSMNREVNIIRYLVLRK